METSFKSALGRIKAEDILKKKTEGYLMKSISSKENVLKENSFRRNNPLLKRIVAVACTAVLLCGASIGAYAYYKTPTSYLSLDINPSVELGVNAFGKVVSATAYNNDGKTILVGQDVINSGVKDAVNTLVKSAAQKGFIAKDGSTVIAVTSETDSSSTAVKMQDAAKQGADIAVKSEGDTATVQKENVALARRDEARKLVITPGKLNLIQKLQALDPSITIDQYKDATVTDIMKKFVELKKEQNGKSGSSESSSSDVSSSSSTTSSINENTGNDNQNSKAAVAQSNNNKGKKSSSTVQP